MHPVSEYTMHNLFNLNHNVSLSIIGKLSKNEIFKLSAMKVYPDSALWNSDFSSIDYNLAKKYQVDLSQIINEDDFVLFDFAIKNKNPFFKDFINSKYQNLSALSYSSLFCSVYYAQAHNDIESILSRGQIMFITENKGNNRILSIDEQGIHHLLTPKAGDIVFLDTWCIHSVLPKANSSFAGIKKKPLKFVAVSF